MSSIVSMRERQSNTGSNVNTDCINLVRLAAALLVLFSHSYPLVGQSDDPLKRVFGLSGGSIAVDVFFLLSGFLIAGSIERGATIRHFIVARILRIYPALWVLLILTCAAAVSAAVLLPAGMSFRAALYDSASYLLRNGSLISTNLAFGVAGLFDQNPYPNAVNGSLWTLPWEVRMYVLLAAAGFAFARFRRHVYLLLAAAGFAVWVIGPIVATSGVLSFSAPWRFTFFYFAGALCRLFSPRPAVSTWSAAAAFALALVASQFEQTAATLAYGLALPLVVFNIAFRRPADIAVVRFLDRNDLSYGVYLYAFPIQQTVIALLGFTSPLLLSFTCTPLVVAAALMSWKFVEAPALALKPRRQQSTAVAIGSK